MPISHNFHARGSALLSALFIMTLVAIATTAMTLRLQIDIYKTHLATKSDRYYLASQLVVFWGINQLKSSYKTLNALTPTGSVADFPKEFKTNYPGLKITGSIYDLQGRFNLNNLRSQQGRKQFRSLLSKLSKTLDEKKIQKLTRSAWYWQNAYQVGRGEDQQTRAFLTEKPPTLPAHLPFVSISELRIIPEVDATVMTELWPYVTALPTETRININTSSEPVLASLGAGLSTKQVNDIIELRSSNSKISPGVLNELLQKYNIPQETVSLESFFFLIVARVKSAENTFTNYSLIQILPDKKNKKKIHLKLLRESFNTL